MEFCIFFLKLEKNENKKSEIEINYRQAKKEYVKLPSLNDIIVAKSNFEIKEKNINLFEKKEPTTDEKKIEENKEDKNQIKEINKEGNKLLRLDEIITEKNYKEKDEERIIEKDKRSDIKNIDDNKILNESLQTNEGNINLIKNNKKDLIVAEKKTNNNIPKKQNDDVKLMINNCIIDDNIHQKENYEYPFDNQIELKCCPDCNIF